MNRAVSGTVAVLESGRPLPGLRVVAARVHANGLDFLGATLTEDYGHFRVFYPPLDGPVDLTLLVYTLGGHLLFTEPIHRQVCGAELSLQVEVPSHSLLKDFH